MTILLSKENGGQTSKLGMCGFENSVVETDRISVQPIHNDYLCSTSRKNKSVVCHHKGKKRQILTDSITVQTICISNYNFLYNLFTITIHARLLYSTSVNIVKVLHIHYLSVGNQYLSVTEDSVICSTESSVK